MKKPSDDTSIAVLAADLRVSRLTVEANPVLDLLEVRRVEPEGRPAAIEFMDRLELARYVEELRVVLAVLEGAAEDVAGAGRRDVDAGERYTVAQVLGDGILRFAVYDRRHQRLLGALEADRGQVDRFASFMNGG